MRSASNRPRIFPRSVGVERVKQKAEYLISDSGTEPSLLKDTSKLDFIHFLPILSLPELSENSRVSPIEGYTQSAHAGEVDECRLEAGV